MIWRRYATKQLNADHHAHVLLWTVYSNSVQRAVPIAADRPLAIRSTGPAAQCLLRLCTSRGLDRLCSESRVQVHLRISRLPTGDVMTLSSSHPVRLVLISHNAERTTTLYQGQDLQAYQPIPLAHQSQIIRATVRLGKPPSPATILVVRQASLHQTDTRNMMVQFFPWILKLSNDQKRKTLSTAQPQILKRFHEPNAIQTFSP